MLLQGKQDTWGQQGHASHTGVSTYAQHLAPVQYRAPFLPPPYNPGLNRISPEVPQGSESIG